MKIQNLSDHIVNDRDFERPNNKGPVNSNEKAQQLPHLQLNPDNGYPRLIDNYKKIDNCQIRQLHLNGLPVTVSLNPTRSPSVRSVISKAVSNCVLCHLHPGQRGFKILDDQYLVVMNPGVTQKGDMTIINLDHLPQEISPNFADILDISEELPDFSIYFNGMFAGASCPHLHFQAGTKGLLAGEKFLTEQVQNKARNNLLFQTLIHQENHKLMYVKNYLCPVYIIKGTDKKTIHSLFIKLMSKLEPEYPKIRSSFFPAFGQVLPGFDIKEREPRVNLIARFLSETNTYFVGIFPRLFNRPKAFYHPENCRILIGLAIKECLGHFITIQQKDYNTLIDNPNLIRQIIDDTSLPQSTINNINSRLASPSSV